MIKDIPKKFSTTQVAGVLTIALTIYNAVAKNHAGIEGLDLTAEDLSALAVLLVPIAPTVYMMWRRTKKSILKWGFFK